MLVQSSLRRVFTDWVHTVDVVKSRVQNSINVSTQLGILRPCWLNRSGSWCRSKVQLDLPIFGAHRSRGRNRSALLWILTKSSSIGSWWWCLTIGSRVYVGCFQKAVGRAIYLIAMTATDVINMTFERMVTDSLRIQPTHPFEQLSRKLQQIVRSEKVKKTIKCSILHANPIEYSIARIWNASPADPTNAVSSVQEIRFRTLRIYNWLDVHASSCCPVAKMTSYILPFGTWMAYPPSANENVEINAQIFGNFGRIRWICTDTNALYSWVALENQVLMLQNQGLTMDWKYLSCSSN